MSIAKVNGIAIADIAKINGIAKADMSKFNGVTVSSAEATLASLHVDDLTIVDGRSGSSHANYDSYFPANWKKSGKSADWNPTIYGSTKAYSFTGSAYSYQRGWVFGTGGTPSSGTGATGGMVGDLDATSGVGATSTANKYIYYEASSPSYSGSTRGHLLRTPVMDFTGVGTITLQFWIHAYGISGGTNRVGNLRIALTDSADSASSADEIASGTGFTSMSAGGLTLNGCVYEEDGSQTYTSANPTAISQLNNAGSQDVTTAGGYYRRVTVDLSDYKSISSTNYIYILVYSAHWASDICLDNIKVIAS